MGEWLECRLAEVCSSIDYGLTASASDSAHGPRFLRITDIVPGHIDWDSVPTADATPDAQTKYRLDDGDIVVARTGASTGTSAYVARPPAAVFASYLVRLKIKPTFDARYVAYYLKSEPFWAFIRGVLGDKSAQPNASASTMTRAPFRAPRSLAEQRRIAEILGALDDKIELNRRTSETLEGTAQALFKSWFLDSRPDASDHDGLLADAVDLLRDLVDPQLEPDTVFQHYSLPAYDAGREAISEPGAGIRSSKLAVPGGSVLLSKLNPEIERVWLPDIRHDDRAICSTEFLVVRPRADVGQAFVYEFLRSAPFRSTLTSLVTGTTGSHQRAHAEAILQVPLRLPSPSRAAKFERLVGPMLDRIAVARRESGTLVALRDVLLPRLLSGETSPSFGRGEGA